MGQRGSRPVPGVGWVRSAGRGSGSERRIVFATVEIGVGRAVGGTVGNDAYYDGIINEVHFWSRALSADEVGQLAAGTLPVAVEPAGKIASVWGKIKGE